MNLKNMVCALVLVVTLGFTNDRLYAMQSNGASVMQSNGASVALAIAAVVCGVNVLHERKLGREYSGNHWESDQTTRHSLCRKVTYWYRCFCAKMKKMQERVLFAFESAVFGAVVAASIYVTK
jgi:hypothetical protein